jgi:hypothetical protein
MNGGYMYKWEPIETIPEGKFVDVWVISKNNPDWGTRVTDVCKTPQHSKGWVGIESRYLTDDIYPAFWIYITKPDAL